MKQPTQAVSITTPGDREIRIERLFEAPPERVWRALTDPGLIAQWWGRGRKTVVERLELRPGGRWRFVVDGVHGAQGFEGRFRVVESPTRLEQTFEWDGMPGHVAVETMVLEDLGDGRTRLITTSRFSTPEERDGALCSGMEEGVGDSYAALDRLLAAMALT